MEDKAYSFPECYEEANQLRRRCSKQDGSIDYNPKQSKDKFSSLTKKKRTVRDKLRSTGFGNGEQHIKGRIQTPIQRVTMCRIIGKS